MSVSAHGTAVARSWAQNLYLVLASVILVGLFGQGFLIGTSLFAGATWGQAAHRGLGLVLLTLTLLLPLAGLLARLSGRLITLSAVLFVLTVIEVTLAGLGSSIPFVAAFHPANAMLLFGLNMLLILHGWQAAHVKVLDIKQAQLARVFPDEGERSVPCRSRSTWRQEATCSMP